MAGALVGAGIWGTHGTLRPSLAATATYVVAFVTATLYRASCLIACRQLVDAYFGDLLLSRRDVPLALLFPSSKKTGCTTSRYRCLAATPTAGVA